MPTNEQRLAWLAARVDYLEHRDAQGHTATNQPGPSGYWSRGVTSDNWPSTCPAADEAPDCTGLDIIEYIDEMIERENSHD